jgi:hypothetical protein
VYTRGLDDEWRNETVKEFDRKKIGTRDEHKKDRKTGSWFHCRELLLSNISHGGYIKV